MCAEGYECTCCKATPVVECHWDSWVMLLCGFHASQYIQTDHPPKLVFILGGSNENHRVN